MPRSTSHFKSHQNTNITYQKEAHQARYQIKKHEEGSREATRATNETVKGGQKGAKKPTVPKSLKFQRKLNTK